MDLGSIRLTSDELWRDALATLVIDVFLLFLLIRWINRARFVQLKWPLVGVAAVFWSLLGVGLYQLFWDVYYRHFAPEWMRGGGVLVLTIPKAVVMALVFHWAALRLPIHPLVSFCLLGGAESWLEHLWGFYGLKILDLPLLQGVSPASILAFAFPEYVFYWFIVIGAALLFWNARQKWVGL